MGMLKRVEGRYSLNLMEWLQVVSRKYNAIRTEKKQNGLAEA